MSTNYKKLFGQKDIILTNESREALGSEVESVAYMTEYFNKKEKFIPPIDFSQPKHFARFGSAEKYYIDAIDSIYKTYPYDGSLKERIQWELSSSYLDLYIFENNYPRTNGYVVFSSEGWGTQAALSDGYGAPPTSSYEYISIQGGPNTSQRTKGKDIQDITGDYKSGYANIWEPSKNRESNLKIGGIDGNTVEFWLKKDEFLGASLTNQEVLFDLYTNNFASSSANYGRLTIELTSAASGSPFKATYMSGTSGFSNEIIGSNITVSSVTDNSWHHYAFTFKNTGSNIEVNLFVDGVCDETIITGSSIDYVSGNINAVIGALATAPSGTNYPTLGWGKLSGSLDEFRFWKTARTSQQVGRYYIEPIGGGTNTDDANTALGIYYKFNEGITLTSSVDNTVLDYSGRISNGNFIGYNSSARSTNSAMVESGKVTKEFKDPILYSFHPEVLTLRETKKNEGQVYDYSNNAAIYHTLPNWILDEDENKEHTPLRNLTQIIGSYFDSLANQVWALPKLKHKNYLSSSFKTFPFSDRLLESVGFSYFPELFSDATALAQFRNREDKSLFKQKLYEVKNLIYQNIYNNIVYIYKTKGTEKSFRNLIRCFGFDNEVYKINLYGNRVTYQLKDNYKSIAEFKKYINFTLTGTYGATVFPVSSSNNPNSTSFISGTTNERDYMALTMETETAFPIRHSMADSNTAVQSSEGSSKSFRAYEPFRTASLFGMHQVGGTTENDLTWAATDYANFQVYAIRDSDFSKRCYFKLTGVGSTTMPTLTSSYFDEVFDDTRWTFSVAIRPNIYPSADLPSASSTNVTSTGYQVEFYGVEKVLDTTKNEFFLTSTISATDGQRFLNNPKSIYIGAHRLNFSGSLQEQSDGNISSTRVWLSHLATGTIQQHAQDVQNYGVPSPYKSAYLYQTSMAGTRVPEIHTLALNWTFDTLTGSDSSGEFIGEDFSSGSTSLQNRYNWIGNIIGKQYLPKGHSFPASFSGSINRKYVYSAKKQLPEFINSSDMVKVLTDDDISFNKGDLLRPTNYYMYIEKSMYQSISEEMIRMFSSIKDFNNLIGEPVNKYRDKYKHMEKLRELFFERVGNTPDLDKYIDFYKWVDQTLDVLLGYLVPASADISDQHGSNIRTLVESHVLERNKYKWQYPTIEDKQSVPEGNILGINELLYDWEYGHDPLLSNTQSDKCLWWKDRAERTDALASGDPSVDSDKQAMLDSINNETNAKDYMLYDNATSTTYSGSTFVTRRLAKPYKLKVDESRTIKGGSNYYPNKNYNFNLVKARKETGLMSFVWSLNYFDNFKNFASVAPLKDCNDDLGLGKKRKWTSQATGPGTARGYYDRAKGAILMPFSLYSSSIDGGYHDTIVTNFMSGADITNLHSDIYGFDKEVPTQSPFTEKFVGGLQYRHAALNTGSDERSNRAEGWILKVPSTSPTIQMHGVMGQDPFALYYRDEIAKRPVNIRNIQQTTASNLTNIGNYTKDYEVLMTNGRSINNRYFTKNEGISASSVSSQVISGVLDYGLPGTSQSQRGRQEVVINGLTSTARNDYIIVNRFSAPGDPSTMGFAFLDIESQEYSVYNSLPWRNLIVRESLQELLTDHTKQFGYFSDTQNSASYVLAGETYPGTSGSVSVLNYASTASFHKVNRNAVRTISLTEDTANFSNEKYIKFVSSSFQYLSGSTGTNVGVGTKFTFSAWINPTVTTDGYNVIASLGDYGTPQNSRFYVALYDDTNPRVSAWVSHQGGATGKEYFTPADSITDNIWQHIAVTFNSVTQDFNIYINGATSLPYTATEDNIARLADSSAPLIFGAIAVNEALGYNYNGSMDEVSYWNVDLSPAEIKEIHDGDSGLYGAFSGPGNLNTHSKAANLISWWRMGDNYYDDVTPGIPDGVQDGGINDNNNDLGVPNANYPASSSVSYLTGASHYLTEEGPKRNDNWFVQHQIPQTDLQYQWITASVMNGYNGAALYGFEQPDFSNASLASTDITFVSQSQIEDANGNKVDFAGINTLIIDPITSTSNTLSSSDGYLGYSNNLIGAGLDPSQILNGLNLHRHGPYGWASWQQTRGSDNPIIRTHRKENRQSFLKLALEGTASGKVKFKKTIVSQIEPPVTSKFKPFKHDLIIKENYKADSPTAPITIRHTYGNEKNWFPQKVSGSLDLDKESFVYILAGQIGQSITQVPKTLIYDSLNHFILRKDMSGSVANPVSNFVNMTLGQTIYPREHYTYLKSTRQRDNFQNGFWRDARADRYRYNTSINSQGPSASTFSPGVYRSDSIWPLDARTDFLTGGTWMASCESLYGFLSNCTTNDPGELQNIYTIFPQGMYYGGLYQYTLGNAAATYCRAVPELFPGALFTGALDSPGEIHGGQTLWEAGSQAGINPFYDSYEYYIEDLKRLGKDYGIIPEFRISEHMDFYVNNNPKATENFLVDNPNFLTLTGSTLSSSGDSSFYTVYSTSDFMEHFNQVRSDYVKTAVPTELKLECKGLMKFLPYDGFYPAQRTLQLATLFSSSYADNITIDAKIPGSWHRWIWSGVLKPILSPGILYNSIKSGISVDYPITDVSATTVTGSARFGSGDGGDPRFSGSFASRVPFEALANPDYYLRGRLIESREPYPQSGPYLSQSWGSASIGVAKNPLYRYAMNNFLAETPSFFLQGGSLSTISSRPDTDIITVQKNKEYKMRIVVGHSKWDNLENLENSYLEASQQRSYDSLSYDYNPPTITMYNRAFNRSTKQDYSSSFVGVSGTMHAYGSSFGPPCAASSSYGYEASFEPFTPPYYNGYSHIEVTYTSDIGGETPITEILAGAQETATYFRECTRLGYAGSTAAASAMQLSSSLNWNQLVTDPVSETHKWVIQPKWECPILDFNSADITLPITGSGSVAKGMWHQYGSIPNPGSGVFLTLQDVTGSESLRDLVGMDARQLKLGRIPEEGKEISEAIVAIPFWAMSSNTKGYFRIHRQTIDWANAALRPPPPAHAAEPNYWVDKYIQTEKPFKTLKPAQSIYEMIKKMKKYVIPPRFDFLTNKSIKPLAMMIFEFSQQLSQQDLSNIWQNLPPTSLSTIVTGSQATISLDLLRRYESFDEDPTGESWKGFDLLNSRPSDPGCLPHCLPSDIQWIVFKVKQKAKTNYFDITAKNEKSEAQTAMGLDPTFKGPLSIPNYSFNWPYDFFSLVELAKIDSTYKLEPHPSLLSLTSGSAISFEESAAKTVTADQPHTQITEEQHEPPGTTPKPPAGPGGGEY